MVEEIDRIGETFKGKTVFLSGATGFLGKVLIEKLLRVTEVKTLYLLVRQKKGKSPKDRVQELFNHVVRNQILFYFFFNTKCSLVSRKDISDRVYLIALSNIVPCKIPV